MTSRREFVERAALSAMGLTLPVPDAPGRIPPATDPQPRPGFLDLLRPPDRVIAQTATGTQGLSHYTSDRWTSDSGIVVTISERAVRFASRSPHHPLRSSVFTFVGAAT